MPLHSSLGNNSETLSQKKEKEKSAAGHIETLLYVICVLLSFFLKESIFIIYMNLQKLKRHKKLKEK